MKISNPRIPYKTAIDGGLRPGLYLYFKGTVNNGADRFAINLMARNQIVMHFNPRFRGWSGVVFNTRRRGWQNEERTGQPFSRGEVFEVLYKVTEEGYQVDVNGKELHLYKHRMPVETVRALRVAGNVSMETIIIGEEGSLGSTLSIPYSCIIDGGLRPGMSVYFKGMVLDYINRFHINLKCGDGKGCDIALHFNPRFKHGEVVVFNTYRGGRWENEERPAGMPFAKGEIFQLVFIVTSEGYQVKVNDRDFHLFKHRMPVELVKAIKIAGDVAIQSIDINKEIEKDIQICILAPTQEPIFGDIVVCPPCLLPPVIEPVMKISQPVDLIFGGLMTGMSVYFKGTVPKDCTGFSINLNCGDKADCDNAFHFNPRFNTNMVVFNTFRSGCWENEERPAGMPFARGEDFEVLYVITSEGYQVIVNGNPFHLFKHRMDLEDVTAIKFSNDVIMEITNIIEGGGKGMEGYLRLGKVQINSIPYMTTINGGLKVGMYMYFRGTVHDRLIRFHINLQNGKRKGKGVALHFNPRFRPSQLVVFNNFNRGWKKEERVHEMPFRKGEEFEMVFIVTEKGYQVNINGTQFYMFKHRMPVNNVNVIKIAGGVSMDVIDIIGGEKGTESFGGLQKMRISKIPHIGPIFGGLRPGTYMYFRGTVPKDATRFAINLQYGHMKGSDKAIHFNPRFKPTAMVVFNSFRNGKWENEERVNKMPFREGQDFEILFNINQVGYQVIVNGRPLYVFRHRMPLEQVSAVKIGGDITMKTLNMTRGFRGALECRPKLGKINITKIPHVGPIFGGLRPGMALSFRGTVPQEIKRFQINLQFGTMKGCDKALHFNPRFDGDEVVVFNSFRNGSWENEERPDGMPFTKGEDFELVFIITAEGYQVNVNGRQFHLFKHRMPVEQVSAIKIAGDVSMATANMTEAGKLGRVRHPGLGEMLVNSIPFVGSIQGCLRMGMYMYFRGTVPQEINRFHINLQYGEKKGCDKALHFNPRFHGGEVVVFNTFQNGSWKKEERVHQMPFRKGEDFELVFIVTPRGYQVNVNGRPLHFFKHRLPVEQVSALKIAGDISMKTVNLTGGGQGLQNKIAVPSIPHVGPILGGLRAGMFVFIRGTVPQEIDRFHINMQYGELKGCDKAMHFNPRFKPREVVVFNSYRNGKWENEERVNEMPFKKGEDFELAFIVTPKGYQVLVNGQQFYMFKHRMPVEQVSALKVAGDISMESIKITGGEDDDQGGRPRIGRLTITKIPHVGPIHRGLRTGMALRFQGQIPSNINRFSINLQCAKKDGCDIALHFNPRFKPYEVVVFNTFRKGRWEKEERPSEMPFRKEEDFEVVFFITEEGYQVYVNGENFHLFKHRMPVENVSALRIIGDVSMEFVDMNEGDDAKPERSGLKEILNIPYLKPISGGLKKGTSVCVKGKVPSKSNRFSINLHCGDKAGCDNACHFNPRFNSNLVVFNTFRNGRWENEERPAGMPVARGEDFEVVIDATSEGYQVIVNDKPFHLFKHRMSLENVSAIMICGDVALHDVDIIEGDDEDKQEEPEEEEKEEKDKSGVCAPTTNIPHVRPIFGGLRPGMSVYFRGTVHQRSKRFDINMHCDENNTCINAFHFCPRLDCKIVVFNTFQNGHWEKDERLAEMPFARGKDFEVLITITTEGYQVYVNGSKFYLYKHRIPVERVNLIKIGGQVTVNTTNIVEGGQEGVKGRLSQGKMVLNTIPYTGGIYGGVKKGMYLYFRGTVHDEINRFHINLQCGDKKGCDKAIHFNPRFKPREVVVFNTHRNGRWENEERVHEMPFRKGEDFELVFIVNEKGYQVMVNGHRFYMFKHRMSVEQVSTLAIAGDVTMKTVKTIGGGQAGIQGFAGRRKMLVTKIPHAGPIYGGLRAGMYMYFRGTVPEKINRFHINLQYGQMKGSDIALHFNPRFNAGSEVVVFNSFRNGSWEKEERPAGMPFTKGEDFELIIYVTSKGYQVNVNGRQFHLFKHRMPVENVSSVNIAGDVSMTTVNMTGGGKQRRSGKDVGLGKMLVTNIPHVGPVYGSLRTGMYLFFKGTVPQDIKRFHINLQYGQMKGSDKALHFNPRFDGDEVVVFNSFRNGSWENEERPAGMPFTKGEDFEMLFIITAEGYQVNVNGRQFHLFKHRMPVEQVSAIKIAGDISMKTVNMTEGGMEDQPDKKTDEQPDEQEMVKIPHVRAIKGGLQPGTYLYFKGTVPQEIKRFHINLQYGQKKGSDKAIHFNPRFDGDEVVVFNSFRNGSWENEERPDGMPFTKGEDFELVFFITAEGYQVNVNGRQFHLFKHRMPVEQVSALKIAGDVSMKTINTVRGGPRGAQGQPGLSTVVVSKIPHVGPVIGGLRPGMCLYFRGTVPQEIKRFQINLQYGKMKGCDKALHFNPRFDGDEVVVFNSFRNGSWENEERPAEMPFRKGEDFELVFFITAEGYQVNVNGHQFHLFKHRMPVEQVSAIKIGGDVSVQTINTVQSLTEIVSQRVPGSQPGVGKMAISKIPHVGPVFGGLRKGMALYFRGSIPQNIDRFHINLQFGELKGSDKAMHFNPRFKPREVVVFNSYRNGKWENEERVNEMPFRRGENFELVFSVTSVGYQVIVNGREFYLFKHRMPLEQVGAIKVAGDVSMETGNITAGDDDDKKEQQEKEKEIKKVAPSIPELRLTYGGLRLGTALYFHGSVHEEAKRFSINLHCGDEEGCDSALHFNPRFEPSDVVVFNTVRNRGWENEERVQDMPFQPGESFKLAFIVTSEGYQVKVNDKKFYLFKHRIPIENVTVIRTFGDVTIETTNVIEGGKIAGQGRLGQGKTVVDKIPFVEFLDRDLRAGTYLYFRGKIDADINRFHINLQSGDTKGCAKALHFNPRFQPHEMVVFNTFQNGKWEREERVKQMPFRKGENFELVIIVTAKGYQVIVNGRRFHMFKHRMPVEQVSAIKVAGDVSVETIDMTEGGIPGYRGLSKMAVTKIPHVEPVFGGLRPGMYLYFRGTVPQDIKRFDINLQYGQLKGSDKAIHFNPRFDGDEVVVFNSFRNGKWQKEERPAGMPFTKGEDFEMLFIITAEGYQVNVNGRQFHLFKHRMPVENVSALKIAGDISIKTVNMIGGGEGGMLPSLGKMAVTSIPHVGPVYGGLRAGMFVFFRGTVPQEINRFHINLQYGKMKGCDKALHFNPRFDGDEVVVFNSFRNGSWENEERPDGMPFTKGEDFEVAFKITAEGYQVYVNGRHFHFFKHRMPVEQVSAIKIAGDVSMKAIDTTEGGKRAAALPLPTPGPVVIGSTPHVEPIDGGLRTGMHLYFKGTVPHKSKLFAINLQNGGDEGCDIALHCNPRFESNVVVFNTFRNGGWQNEERPAEMPFHRGEDFELLIIVTSEGYQVNVNGEQFHFYKHRMPVEEVSAVKVVPYISIQDMKMTEGGEDQPSIGKTVIGSTPHVEPIDGSLRTGMRLYFKGTVPQESDLFAINLQNGGDEGCDIALHCNPRFESNVVVFNTFRNGGWQNEERPAEMPFHRGEDFELLIIVTSEGYQVNVNGQQFHFYKHRMPVEEVSAVKVVPYISIQDMKMTEGGQDQPSIGKTVIGSTPHVEPIDGSLRTGMCLYFKGTVPQESNLFAINLQNGGIEGCDIALHCNPRFESNVVVFNTFRNGGWQNEERPAEMPFHRGEDFELVIIVTSEGYQVNVNGRQFHFYKHRMPVEEVSAVKVVPYISIQDMKMIEGGQDQPGIGKTVIDKIPNVVPTYGGLRPGMYLYFKGTIPQEIKRFHINLQYGQLKGSDKAIHFNPRFDGDEVVVFNSFRNGSWENEERPAGMPFTKGEDFELVFFITSEGYQVNVNGRQFHLFKHRMPVEQVSAIKIAGDVAMKTLNTIEGGQGVEGAPVEGVIDVPKIPHVGPVYGGLRAGMALFFQGTIPEDIKRFHINLQYGRMKGCDKAFHFNPRFEGSKMVVFNSFRNGTWENEERVNKMPFQPGKNFVLAFIITSEGYQVIVNGRRFYTFKHRMPVEQVTTLKIGGSIFIESAKMMEGEKVDIKEKPAEKEEPVVSEVQEEVNGKPADKEEPAVEEEEKPAEIDKPAVCEGEEEVKEKPVVCEGEEEVKEKPEIDKPAVSGGDEEVEEKPAQKEEPESEPEDEVISGDLKPGMAVYLKGTIPSEIRSFAINLRCGDTKDSDIALSFNPRFEPSEVVVLNSFQNGSWGPEEKLAEMPFQKGESFELVFHVTEEDYKVYVARRLIYSFKHRIPVEQVQSVQVIGEVSMQVSNFIDIGNVGMQKESDDDEGTQTVMNLPDSLKAGLSMSFQGTIPGNSSRFSIKLQCGDTDDCDTAFHFNPQLDTSEVVFNSFKNGSWETEEKVTEIPFTKGESFLLVYMLKSDGYQVNVNGRPLYMFKYRMPLEEVRTLKITGDVSIENINIVEIVQVGIDEEPEETETVQCQVPIPSALKTDTSMTFQGIVPEETKSFSINMQCGDADGSDVAFQFSSQFETSEVLFNTFRNGSWEEAEKVDNMPFTKGEKFELVYIITAEGYQVNVNGAEFYLYKHRIPVEQVKILQFAGDVSVQSVNIVVIEDAPQASQQNVQAEVPISDCLKAFVTMSLKGMVPEDGDQFTINLQCGNTDGCDTAFHFNPRLGSSEVVFNSFQNGSWQEEEKIAQMPFSKGENFELTYSISMDGYQVNVNGQPLHFFKHRMPVEQVAILQIIGDISLGSINMIGTSPSVTPIPGSLKMGSSVTFKGTLPSESTRFSIDLTTEEAEGSDTVFSFHPQFEPAVAVVFNSFRNGSWEEEEKVAEMPFHQGEDFELVYLITEEGYQVNVNGEKYYMFKHRMPVEQVKALQISGNVTIPSIDILEGGAFILEETTFKTVTSSAPYMVPLPGGFKAGTSVTFTGSIAEGIPDFSIDLQCGEADGSDKALRVNGQFEPAEAVVFNSFLSGSWGQEERVDATPFRRGEDFELTILVTSEGYQMKVKDADLHTFKHRIPSEQVSTALIIGNIQVTNISIIEPAVMQAPSGFGQLEVTGCLGDETLICGIGELERGDGDQI